MWKEVQAGIAAPLLRAAPPVMLAVELCCPPLPGPRTTSEPGRCSPGVSPLLGAASGHSGPLLQGPHLYANHLRGPHPTDSREA